MQSGNFGMRSKHIFTSGESAEWVHSAVRSVFYSSHNFLYGSDLRVYNDDKRFYGQVVHETRSTTIHGFEQSELDVIIDCIGKF